VKPVEIISIAVNVAEKVTETTFPGPNSG